MRLSQIFATLYNITITYAVNARVCYNDPVMQGLRIIQAQDSSNLYNSKALHR